MRLAISCLFVFMLLACDADHSDKKAQAPQKNQAHWAQWQAFKQALISTDGRVIDKSDQRNISTSEGQSYALFFALVANEPQTFARLLKWTQNNLANGDLTARLPAWLWGRITTGGWGIIDANSAADADLWIAYTLFQAAELWHKPEYSALASQLSLRILQEETAYIPGLGINLLPAPYGFVKDSKAKQLELEPKAISWKLNPSYLPIQLHTYLAKKMPNTPWLPLLKNSKQVLLETAHKGFSVDWALYQKQQGWQRSDPQLAKGSYNAIRVYLWAGMLNQGDAFKTKIINSLYGMTQWLIKKADPPITTNNLNGQGQGVGSIGFSAALLPFLAAQNQSALQRQISKIAADPISPANHGYYDQVLALFGQGWFERRFHFDVDGRLIPAWLSE